MRAGIVTGFRNARANQPRRRQTAHMSSDDRQHNLEVVEQFFSGPRDLDRLSLMSDDCEWFNGIGKFPAAPGQTIFVGQGRDRAGRPRAGAVTHAAERPQGRPLRPHHRALPRRAHHRRRPVRVPPARLHRHDARRPRLRQRLRLPLPLRRRRPDRPRVGALGHPRRLRAAVPVRPRGARPRRAADDDAVGAAAPRSRAAGPTRRDRAVPRRRGARAERLEHPAVQVPLHRRRRAQARHRRALPHRDAGVRRTGRAPTRPRTTSTAPPSAAAHRPQRVPPARPPARGPGAVRARSSPAAPTASARARRPNARRCSGSRAGGAR